MKKRMMLYFGSFNPIHKGHISMAECAIERGLCDHLALIVSPQNPLKKSGDLLAEHQRFEMAELACAASKYPERISPSVIEFLLPKPSYTINTLRHLSAEYGSEYEFSILMGGDLVAQLHLWREYEEILACYPIFVYPRPGEKLESHLDKITIIEDAPLFNISSTELRLGLKRGENMSSKLCPEVLDYIRKNDLLSEESYLDELARLIDCGDEDSQKAAYLERAKINYKHQKWSAVLNDLSKLLDIEPDNIEAQTLKKMAEEILEYRYTDQFNP